MSSSAACLSSPVNDDVDEEQPAIYEAIRPAVSHSVHSHTDGRFSRRPQNDGSVGDDGSMVVDLTWDDPVKSSKGEGGLFGCHRSIAKSMAADLVFRAFDPCLFIRKTGVWVLSPPANSCPYSVNLSLFDRKTVLNVDPTW